MRSVPTSTKTPLKDRLNNSADIHNGYSYNDFVGFVAVYTKKGEKPNKSQLARLMNVSRDSIYKWLKDLGQV